MSHGGSGDSGAAMEPNLTPLLDVVLQLLMFFMMCVNFVTEQVSGDVKLPVAQSARPMGKSETDVLFLNVKPFRMKDFETKAPDDLDKIKKAQFAEGDPCILIVGRFPMKLVELRVWLREQYAEKEKEAKGGKVTTAIILRAHEAVEYKDVYEILNMAKIIGYRTMKLRALTK